MKLLLNSQTYCTNLFDEALGYLCLNKHFADEYGFYLSA
jgi:hypothetical protein